MIAILLMSVANIFILVHAVVPHFHHDGIVCFDSDKKTTCTDCHIYGEGEECCDDHEAADTHHGHLESCDLSQIVERVGDPSEDLVTISPSVATFLVCVCTLDCYDLLVLADIVVARDEGYKPYIDTYNSPYVGSSYSLRAPPHSIIS